MVVWQTTLIDLRIHYAELSVRCGIICTQPLLEVKFLVIPLGLGKWKSGAEIPTHRQFHGVLLPHFVIHQEIGIVSSVEIGLIFYITIKSIHPC